MKGGGYRPAVSNVRRQIRTHIHAQRQEHTKPAVIYSIDLGPGGGGALPRHRHCSCYFSWYWEGSNSSCINTAVEPKNLVYLLQWNVDATVAAPKILNHS